MVNYNWNYIQCSPIRETTPLDLFTTILASSVDLLGIVIKGALALGQLVKHRQRGVCQGAGSSMKAQSMNPVTGNIPLQHAFSYKMDELQLLMKKKKNRDFSTFCVFCFMETWLCGLVPDLGLQLQDFQLFLC